MRINVTEPLYDMELIERKDDIFRCVYFTDVHFGLNGHYRSDSITEAIKKKLNKIKEFKNGRPETYMICGGDLFDVPRFTPNLDPQYPAINFDILDFCKRFQQSTSMIYCLGNHDYSHGPDVEYNLKKSPISLIDIHEEPYHLFHQTQLFVKHWKPTFDQEKWDEGDGIKVMVTHEAIAKGSMPFDDYVQMESYETAADIVLTADIHTHQGVNVFNDTVFISPGAVTRTNSGEKNKKPYFAHIILRHENTLHVNFISLLDSNDNPDDYWVDVRDIKLKDKDKKDIRSLESIDKIKEILTVDEIAEGMPLEATFEMMCKALGIKDEKIKERFKSI